MTSEIKFLPARQLWVKSRPHLQEARNPSLDCNPPGRWFGDPGQHLRGIFLPKFSAFMTVSLIAHL